MLLFVAPIAPGGWLAYKHVDSGFMPSLDEGGFILDYKKAPVTSADETDRLLREVEAILRKSCG